MRKYLISYLEMVRLDDSDCVFEKHISYVKAPSSTQAIIHLWNQLAFPPVVEKLKEV